METILPKLDHSKSKLHEAFGLSLYERYFLKTVILFETLSTKLLVSDLYDDPKDAPSNMSTVTGILEKSIARVTDPKHQFFLAFTFMDTYEMLAEIVSDLPEKSQLGKIDGKSSIEEIVQKMMHAVKAGPIIVAIEVIKETNHDFDAFIARLLPPEKYTEEAMKDSASSDDDLDELIRKALRRDKDKDED